MKTHTHTHPPTFARAYMMYTSDAKGNATKKKKTTAKYESYIFYIICHIIQNMLPYQFKFVYEIYGCTGKT